MSTGSDPGASTVMRNRVNFVSGYVLGYGILLGILTTDPLALYRAPGREGSGPLALNLAFTCVAALISIGGYVLFARPSVVIDGEQVVVRGTLRDHSVSRADILDVRMGLAGHPVLVTRRGEVPLLALEKYEPSAIAEILAKGSSTQQSRDDNSCDITTRAHVRLPTASEWLIIGVWMSYVTLGVSSRLYSV